MRIPIILFLFGALAAQLAAAQSPDILTIRKHVAQHTGHIINEFVELLTLPNVAADPTGLQKNAAFIMNMMNTNPNLLCPL